jgi:asparagine synthase (glutamine-hydrolysing)
MAFDGRLDHRDDLCAALGVPPAERSVPDPELILRAHEKWGTDCAAKLEGEFAFAMWDERQRELFCVCDVFGQREFYYHTDGKRFVFASRIRGVLAVPGVPRRLDELTMGCRLGGLPQPAERTLYEDIRRLPNAHLLTLRAGQQPSPRQYWRLAMEPELQLGSPQEYAEALRELLKRAVCSALRTHHPVAVMLSGGLDSTGMACLAARELAARGQRLTTVSNILPQAYEGDEWGREESAFIRSALAMYPSMDPQWAYGLKFPAIELEDAHYEQHDEPDNDTKSFRTRELVQLAEQQGARVLLGGLGGDMAASFRGTGYLEQLVRSGQWLELARQLQLQSRMRQIGWPQILKREVMRPLSPQWLRRWHDRRRTGLRPEWEGLPINLDFAARLNLAKLRHSFGQDRDAPQDFRKHQLALVNAAHLRVGSSWAESHSSRLEGPQPLMDRRIWEWCHRVPVGEFVRDGMPRSLFRQALWDVLPESVLRRTSKGWFAPDHKQRMADSRPAVEAFLAAHPASDPVWAYVNRTLVLDTLRLVQGPRGGNANNTRYHGILCKGLRHAHFLAWLERTA